jgi:hypothetical protein
MLTVVLALLGAIGSIVGIGAYVDARRNKRVKFLAWERTYADALASASKAEGDYKLSILYERAGSEPEVIQGAFVTYVRFANFGKEPIRRADIASANPLRIVVKMREDEDDCRVLDISLGGSSRDVIRLNVGSLTPIEHGAEATVDFDFLDFHDGGVVRIFSSGRPASVELCGDVIGMPQGIARTDVAVTRNVWSRIGGVVGAILWVLSEAVGFGLTVVLFHYVTGSWSDAWLLVLPPVIFVGLGLFGIFVSDTIWPSSTGRKKFPSALAIPRRHPFRTREGHYVFREDMAWEDLEESMQSVAQRPKSKDKGPDPTDSRTR